MNVEETIAIIEALKAEGATYFKSRDFEVSFGQREAPKRKVPRDPAHAREAAAEETKEAPLNEENTKKAAGLIDLLKLKDDALVDALFPDGAGGD